MSGPEYIALKFLSDMLGQMSKESSASAERRKEHLAALESGSDEHAAECMEVGHAMGYATGLVAARNRLDELIINFGKDPL